VYLRAQQSLTTRRDISKARATPRRSSSLASSTLRDSVGSSGTRARCVQLRLHNPGYKAPTIVVQHAPDATRLRCTTPFPHYRVTNPQKWPWGTGTGQELGSRR
jgi:hypothetical protein